MDTDSLMMLYYLPFIVPFIAAAFVVWLVVGFFFLLNLRDLLTQVSPQNRAMQPDQVWLNLIPLFNLVWIFVTIVKVRDSVSAEFQSRGWAPKGDFSFGLGIAAAILTILSWGPFGLAALVCWIVYWIRMSELKSQLIAYRGYSPSASRPPGVSAAGGESGVSASYCAFCGTALSPGASFCRSCGRPVD
jgi:hypothetical protein